jgi:hypothetical protein
MPTHQPQQPKPKRGWLAPVLVAVALIFGFGVGAIKPTPEPVTITREVPVDKIVTKEVPVTPQACITALEGAGEIIDLSGKTIGVISDNVSAAAKLDVSALRANNEKVEANTEKLKGITPGYVAAREECQASAE